MLTSSAKAKGRKLQQDVMRLLFKYFPDLEEDDLQSCSMGAQGEDIKMSPVARRYLPVSIECKNQEKVAVWASYEQAKLNSKKYEPLLVIKRNKSKPLAVVDLEWFLNMMADR